MIVKDLFGNYAEAFNLLLKKQFAYAILTKQKTMEFRDFFSDHLLSMFYKETKNQKSPDYMVARDIRCIHFHDYNNSWFLDVLIEGVDAMAIHPDNREYFHSHDCHEFDEEMDALETAKTDHHDKDVRWFIVCPIQAIINTDLDLSALPEGSVDAYELPTALQIPPEIAEKRIAEQKAKMASAKVKKH